MMRSTTALPVSGSVHSLQELRLAVLGGVVHDDDDALDPGDEVHGAAHALDQLAGDHPVGEVAFLGDLHRAEDRHVDLAAADHAEASRPRRNRRCGRSSVIVCLPALIRSASILVLGRERAHAEHAVLGLQRHVDAVGDVVRDQRRDADAEVHVHAVLELLGGAGGHLVAVPGHVSILLQAARDGALLDALLVRTLDDAVHEDAGRVDAVRVERPSGTISSTSATQTLPQVAAFGLKLRAVLR